MARLNTIAPASAQGQTQELFDAVKQKLGVVPKMLQVLANSPAALQGYLQFSGALAGGTLPAQDRERIALAVGQANGCEYCLAAHSLLGKKAGLTNENIRESRVGEPEEAHARALIQFTRKIVRERGKVSDEDVAQIRDAGFTDGQIAEIVGHVALNVYTNYFNNVSQPEVDFPPAEVIDHHEVCATVPGCDPTR